MNSKTDQYELQSAMQRLLDRIEGRITWFVGLIFYSWLVLNLKAIWLAFVEVFPYLSDWSHSDLAAGILQVTSIFLSLVVGKVIGRLVIIGIDESY